MPDGMTHDKMTGLGFTNIYEKKPETEGEYEVMCKAGHIHTVKYRKVKIGEEKYWRWTIPSRCGWGFGWWREINQTDEAAV